MNESQLLKHLYESGITAFEYALQLSQRDEWQLWNNAPKTGDDFLAYDDGQFFICCWKDDFWGIGTDCTTLPYQGEPTYWKPISPPVGEEE